MKTISAALLSLVFMCPLAYSQTNVSGEAISFNGSTDLLGVPQNVWFNGDLTIEAWVYVRHYNNWSRLIDFSDGPDQYNVYLALSGSTTGQPHMGVFTNGGGPQLTSSATLPTNQWAHLAATIHNGVGTIYINGNVTATGPMIPAPGVFRTHNYIAHSPYAGDLGADAIFDELRIWSVARSQNDIQANMNHPLAGNEPGLLAYWRMDEGSGSITLGSVTNLAPSNLTSNGTTAFFSGGTWTNSGAPITPAGNYALGFTNQVATIPHVASQDSYPLTVMCWFSTSGNSGAMVNKYVSSSYNGWQLAFSGNQVFGWYYRDSADFVGYTGTGPVDSSWHHAALVVDSAGSHLYLDGTLKATNAWQNASGACTTTIPISLGVYQGDSFYAGGVDEVSIWKTNLGAAQIQYYKNYPPRGTEPGLVAVYRLNEGIGTNIFDATPNLNTGWLNSPPPTWIPSLEQIFLPPSIIYTQTVSFTGDSANLSALVNPNGSATAVWMAYYNQQTGLVTTNLLSGNVGSDSNNVPVYATITNLSASTFYNTAIIASNAAGTVSSEYSFTTPDSLAPALGNVGANVLFNMATLVATVNPNGAPTTLFFAYGPTASYGITNIQSIGSDTNVLVISNALPPLAYDSTYHLQVTASNADGSVSSSDVIFQTTGGAPVITNGFTSDTFSNTTLSASVNPNGAPTTVWLAYGTTASYGTTNIIANLGSGNGSGIPISQVLSNLPIQTAFHYMLIASNLLGVTTSGDLTFESATYLLGFTSLLESPQAGADSVLLSGMPSNVWWTAVATVPWLHLGANTNGNGNRNIIFTFDQNFGPPRTGLIASGNQTVTVLQAGATYASTYGVLDFNISSNSYGYIALDAGNNLYFVASNITQISRVDYATKAVTPFFSNPTGCYSVGIDGATNLYFYDYNWNIFELPPGSTAPSFRFHGTNFYHMAVSASGDLFVRADNFADILMLPASASNATYLFATDSNLDGFAVDAADNLFVSYFTNSPIYKGGVYSWSPANPTLTPVLSIYSSENVAVDGSDNLYVFENGQYKRQAASGSYSPLNLPITNLLDSIAVGNWGDVFTSELDFSIFSNRIRQYEHAFVNARGVLESSAAGVDTLAAIVPTNAYLGGPLTPASMAPWLTINGVTNGVITFSFSTFAGPGNRTGYLNVLGIPIPVTQGNPTYSLGVNSMMEGPSAGTDSVMLAISPGFANWTAMTNSPWLHLAAQNGSGSGPVVFSFDANPGPTRTGSLTIGDQTFTVIQAGSTYVPATTPIQLAISTNQMTSLAIDAAGDVVSSTYGYVNNTNFVSNLWLWYRTNNTVYFSTNHPSNLPVSADWAGNAYVLCFDSYPYLIQKYYPPTGAFTTVLSLTQYIPDNGLFAVDLHGNIYFVDGGTGDLVEYEQALGKFEILVPGPINPLSITVDSAGNVYWSDSNHVMKWNAATLTASEVVRAANVSSLAVDAGGNLYFWNSFTLEELSAVTGAISVVPLSASSPPAQMAIDPAGNLYVEFYGPSNYYTVSEIPRAFIDTTPKIESLASGLDALLPVIPSNTDLYAPFAPSSDQPWLTINSVTNGIVKFAYTSSATARAGNINVLGVHTLVTQGTNYLLAITNLVEGPGAGSDSFVFGTIPAGASWTASTGAGWLHFASSGSGSGNQIFSFDANPGSTRSGTITIAGRTLTIVQAGTNYTAVNPQLTLLTSANGLYGPCGVALDAKGNVFVADTYNNAIKMWCPTNNQFSVLSTNGFNLPYALTVDGAGNVYIADTYNSLLKKWSPATSNVTIVPISLWGPYGVAADAAGNVYISDTFDDAIKKWSPVDGSVITLYFNPESRPKGLAVDVIGNVYWIEQGTGRVREWLAASNNVITLFTPSISDPYGVAVDGRGNVYMADYNLATTYEWIAASNTVVTHVANTLGVAIDAAGNQFIADALDSQIYEVPHAFIDLTPKYESLSAGHDAIAPVLPTNEDLLPPLVPQSSQPWLTITGITNDAVSFAYSASANARFGTITILGQVIPVNQGTNSVLGTTNLTEGPGAGADSFVFGTVPVNAAWTASANAAWLHFTNSGTGSGNQIFSYDANPGSTRSGTITIAGLTLTVTQAGSSYVAANSQLTLLTGANGLGAPCGVALDANGNVFIADTYNNAIKMWNPTNNQITVLATSGFSLPYALTVDRSGNVFIADTYNNVLKQWSPANSNVTTVVSGLNRPNGVAADSAGNIYIGDTANNSVKIWFPATNGLITLYSNANTYPLGVALDTIGNVYWVEGGTGLVRKWSVVTNNVTTVFSFSPIEPHGVAVDGSGNVYLADYGTATTYKWSAASNTVSSRLANTIGVAVDANENEFIASAADSQIYEVPHAFVDPTQKNEPLSAGHDTIAPVLPTNEDLMPPVAPQSSQPWLTITGVTNGAVSFAFSTSANARFGTISILGQSIFVNQGTYSVLGTTNLTEGPGAGSDSFVLGVIPAAWTASANVPWLHVPASGVGSGNVIFSFDANSGPTRSGTITIGSQSLTVTQAGSTYVLANPPTYLAGGNAPCGLAVDAAGNVFYCDTYNSAVNMWCPTNNQTTVLGNTGFNIPYALTVDRSGNVFVADTFNNVLKQWSPTNTNFITVVTNLVTPYGVAADSAGNIYIGDSGHDSVKEWFPGTNGIITLYTNAGANPRGVAVDAIGNVYWVEGSGQVRKWSVATTNVTTLFSNTPCEPRGVAVDGSGNVYLADYCNNITYMWSAASNTVFMMTNDTIGVAVDANQNEFIASAAGFRVYEVPRAFVDPTTRIESPAGGQDVLPPILPTNEDLLYPLQPTTGDAWINLTGNSGGAVHFTFPASASARGGAISLYGYSIAILQTNNAFPPFLTGLQKIGPTAMKFSFTNNPNGSFTVLASTNMSLPLSNWTVLGTATNLSNNLYQFTDPTATNPAIFYRVRSP